MASRICGARPRFGSNSVRQVIALTTVSTAHGTSTTVRRRPRPLNASCMAMAMPSPIASSSVTEMPVKMNVFFTASQNSLEPKASV